MCRQYIVPALNEALRLYDPSMAASKDRMVSSGRSIRGRVGLDRSGSAVKASETLVSLSSWAFPTDDVSICIAVLKISNGFDRGSLEGVPSRWSILAKVLDFFASDLAHVPGCASCIALVGSALVLIWNAAFSLAVSAASTLGIDPLLVFLVFPVKLSIELLRFLAIVGRARAGALWISVSRGSEEGI